MPEFDDALQTNGSPKLAANSVTDRMVEAAWEAYVEARDGRPMHAAIKAALREQPAPEPVAWMDPNSGNVCRAHWLDSHAPESDIDRFSCPLYTHPPQPDDKCCTRATCRIGQRVPLTDEQIVDAVRQADLDWQAGWTLDEDEPNRLATLARAIELAHGIGGEE